MSDWPTQPVIYIRKGYRKYYGPIDPVYAFRCPDATYFLMTDSPDEGYLIEERGDRISEWIGITLVPEADLIALEGEFRGLPLPNRCMSALLKVAASLTPIDNGRPTLPAGVGGGKPVGDRREDRHG